MCYTSGSLQHALGQEWDIVIVDECHEAASDDAAYKLAQFRGRPRMYGLSGSQDMRWDGKDMRCEALFGPILMEVGYQEGVANRMLVPLLVHWRDVVMDVDPCDGLEDVPKKRWGLWRNDYRNGLIAQDCRRHPGEQVIVTCESVEHIVHLKRLVPEATLVYAVNGMEDRVDANGRNRREQYIAQGFLPADEPPNSADRHQGLLRALQAGQPGIYICTGVINVGIDLKHCLAVCRAEGTASAIMDTQVPGRVSRINGTKTEGHVYDYRDQFNPRFQRNATSRSKNYAGHGWRQEFPPEDAALKSLVVRQAQRRGS
jgi:superfamily II DNA or RNA helicase